MGSAAQYFEVEAPVEQIYAYWRDFSNFPAFMPDVQEITVTGPTTSHWKVSGPLGKSVEWDAEIVEDLPNQRIAWRSIGDADVDNAGAVPLRQPRRHHQHRGLARVQPARQQGR